MRQTHQGRDVELLAGRSIDAPVYTCLYGGGEGHDFGGGGGCGRPVDQFGLGTSETLGTPGIRKGRLDVCIEQFAEDEGEEDERGGRAGVTNRR